MNINWGRLFAATIICLILLFVSKQTYAVNVKTYIPKNAYKYLDLVEEEQNRLLPTFPFPFYFDGLIEHESCISLTHSRCWNPKSRLKTKREEGAGVGQLTRAYRSNGSLRFDSLKELRDRNREELEELSWSNIYSRPDLQIRAIILMTRSNWNFLYIIDDSYERLAMADAAYNGGLGGVRKERRACGLAANCNPQLWFNNVERYCMKSKRILYANRNACDINRHHVTDVLEKRMPKYEKYYKDHRNQSRTAVDQQDDVDHKSITH